LQSQRLSGFPFFRPLVIASFIEQSQDSYGQSNPRGHHCRPQNHPRRYHAADWFGILRRDREFSASVSVSHRKIQFAGITPQIVGVWQRVRSNHFFYPYRKGNVFIQFGRTF